MAGWHTLSSANYTFQLVLDKSVIIVSVLGAMGAEGSFHKEISKRLTLARVAMPRIKQIWKTNISTATKIKLFKNLVLAIMTYGCESWTLNADTEQRLRAFEMNQGSTLTGDRGSVAPKS